jgi:hypothetical protein
MQSDAPTPTTCSAQSESPDTSADLARKIQENSWWQGSILADESLRLLVGDQLPSNATHWILASQTCNLYNADFEKIRLVEWVGARKIGDHEKDTINLGGRNPRVLHCSANEASGLVTWLECDLQLRAWVDRKLLADAKPLSIAFVDHPSNQANLQCKDIFIRWVARSYTRLELSNELGDALKNAKISELIRDICKKYESDLFGVFLDIDDDTDGTTKAVEIKPPCSVEIFFVLYSESHQTSINSKIENFFNAEVPNPDFSTGSNISKKIKRKDILMKRFGLRISAMVHQTTEWNISDLERTIRYSYDDYFSGSDEDPTE